MSGFFKKAWHLPLSYNPPPTPPMSKSIAIHWSDAQLAFVVADNGYVEAVGSVPLAAGLDASAIGNLLAGSLSDHSPSRARVVVALSRENLEWQHLTLPPCPEEELPDLVRLQADYDFNGSDEDIGFDYLSLSGDEATSHHLLTVSANRKLITRIRDACRTANLTLERIVPLAAGWPAITPPTASGGSANTQICVAPEERTATLWAMRDGRMVLFRQFQLSAPDHPEARTTAMVNELRRTLISLSQGAGGGQPSVALVSSNQAALGQLSTALGEQLGAPVAAYDVAADQPKLSNGDAAATTLPLAGLAINESQSIAPLVDLLHPHRRPAPQINVRTYALAGVAGLLLVALIGWTGYSRLHAPLEQAAVDQAELDLLEESLDDLAAYEQRAAAIRNWQAEAPNLLLHLQQLSKSFRPTAMSDRDFPVDQDVLLEKLDLNKRQLTIDAVARNRQAVFPLETRLRQLSYGPQRGTSGPSETVDNYPWQFRSSIDITADSDPTGAPPEEDPQS